MDIVILISQTYFVYSKIINNLESEKINTKAMINYQNICYTASTRQFISLSERTIKGFKDSCSNDQFYCEKNLKIKLVIIN